MPKVPYLQKTKGRWVLRRRIPREIRELCEKTEFKEGCGLVSYKEAAEKARVFGVKTDAEIRKHRKTLANNKIQKDQSGNEPRFAFTLNDHEIEQVALAYFHEKDTETYKTDGYLLDENVANFADLLNDARLDLNDATVALKGGQLYPNEASHSSTNAKAAKQLVKYGYLDVRQIYKETNFKNKKILSIPVQIKKHSSFQRLCRLLERADAELTTRRLMALEKGVQPTINDIFFEPMVRSGAAPEPTRQERSKTVKQLTEEFLTSKFHEVGSSRRFQFNIPIRVLQEQLGDNRIISEIQRDECEKIAELLPTIPAYLTQRFPKLSIDKAIASYEKQHGGKASRRAEASKALEIIKAIFEIGLDREWIDRNPFARVKITGKKRDRKKHTNIDGGYQSFTTDELQKIFSAPLFTGCENDTNGFNKKGNKLVRRHRYWAPIIALWTGARMNEILQLERADIKQIGGIWCLSVTDEEEISYDPDTFTKHLKNQNAIRDIPIHPRLISFGFIEWVNTVKKGRLFPEASSGTVDKPSILFSKRFKTFLSSRKVWQVRKKVFHSFRNNFNDELRKGGVHPELRETINGWARQHEMDAKYGHTHKVDKLYAEICKVEYADLELSHLEPSNWQNLLTDQ